MKTYIKFFACCNLAVLITSCGNKNIVETSQTRREREKKFAAADSAVLQSQREFFITITGATTYYALNASGDWCKTTSEAQWLAIGGKIPTKEKYRSLDKAPQKSRMKRELTCPTKENSKPAVDVAQLTVIAQGNIQGNNAGYRTQATFTSLNPDPGYFPLMPGLSQLQVEVKCTGNIASAYLELTENGAPLREGRIDIPSPFTLLRDIYVTADANLVKTVKAKLSCVSAVDNSVRNAQTIVSVDKIKVSNVAVTGSVEDREPNKELMNGHNGVMSGSLAASTTDRVVLRIHCEQTALPQVFNKSTSEWKSGKEYILAANSTTQSGTVSLEFKCDIPKANVKVGTVNIQYTAPVATTTPPIVQTNQPPPQNPQQNPTQTQTPANLESDPVRISVSAPSIENGNTGLLPHEAVVEATLGDPVKIFVVCADNARANLVLPETTTIEPHASSLDFTIPTFSRYGRQANYSRPLLLPFRADCFGSSWLKKTFWIKLITRRPLYTLRMHFSAGNGTVHDLVRNFPSLGTDETANEILISIPPPVAANASAKCHVHFPTEQIPSYAPEFSFFRNRDGRSQTVTADNINLNDLSGFMNLPASQPFPGFYEATTETINASCNPLATRGPDSSDIYGSFKVRRGP